MAEKSNIEEIFRSALEHHEEAVRPELWSGIQASLANTAATAGTSAGAGAASAGLGKAAAVIGMAALVTGATISEVRYHQAENADHVAATTEQMSTPDQNLSPEEQAEEVAAFEHQETEESNTSSAPLESTESVSTKEQKEEEGSDPLLKDIDKNEGELSPSEMANAPAEEEESATSSERQEESGNGSVEAPTEGEMAQQDKSASQAPSEEKAEEEEDEVVVEDNLESNDKPEPQKTTAYFTHKAEQWITPNGDPYNEYFQVEGYGVDEFFIRIMTQAGAKVFESTDINFRWNGTDRFGNALPAGVYYYEIQATGTDGLPYLEKNAKGNVTIVRD